jgi:hypothetical protein
LPWHEAGIRYGLLPRDRQCYINLVTHVPLRWYNLLADQHQAAAAKEYLGLFATEDAEFLGIIFSATKDYRPSLEAGDRHFTLPAETPQFYLSSASMLLQLWLIQPPATEVTYDAYIKRVRIITTAKGACFYFGIINQLLFDPGRWRWASGAPLMAYTTRLGQKLMNPRHQLTRGIPEKWHGLLPMTYRPRWCDIWNKHRPQKEAGFLWSVLHCAVAVNSWRAQMAPGIPISCICCPAELEETVIHRFYKCERTRRAWHFALTVLYTYLEIPPRNGGWPTLTWQ